MIDPTDIPRLLHRYFTDELTPDEAEALRVWRAASEANEALFARLRDTDRMVADLSRWYTLFEDPSVVRHERVKKKVLARIATPTVKTRRLYRWWPYAAAAAALVLALGTWLFLANRQQAIDNQLAATDIVPGGNRASLTLADGRTISLSEAQTGIIVGDEISYTDGTAVLEQGGGSPFGTEKERLTTNDYVLTTPKGGTYQITLPDGSKAWINAASTLKYSSRFNEAERTVEVSGEVFFSVSKDAKRPFRVFSEGQEIEVIGTEFNVSAYPDDPETKTTLVEGAVQVTTKVRAQVSTSTEYNSVTTKKLRPGDQATVHGAHIETHQVDVQQYTVWKDGLFDFTGMTLPEVMRQLERWYDIEVVWEGAVPSTRYLGQIYRNNNLSQVLKILESAEVRFSIEEGRKLIIH